jgi:hypothetical protein
MSTAHRLLFAGLFTLCACGEDPKGDDTADTDDRPPGEDVTVTVFDGEHVYFGDENRRQVDVEVSFPDDATTYSGITGRFALRCPDDGCDHWDRYGTFGIVLDPGTEDERYVELDRHITAYRVGFSWEADLTDLRPLLTGTQTMRVFIDTWVGPGHSDGAGWLFDAAFDFTGGPPPSPEPIANIPVWGHLSWNAGLDDQPVETQVEPTSVELPAEASAATFRSFITGHGWNNSQNCAEFCEKEHFYTVGGSEFGRLVWRDDCSETVTDGTQMGTWTYSRAGWCPGAQVWPWDTDVSDLVTPGEPVDLSYRLEDFSFWGDGDQPYYYMSGMLIAYR